jgi:threonine/homoserine/homoserine lactone efflux protein
MIDAFIKGAGFALLLIFSVGPVIFTIINQSIIHGRKGGFAFILGVWLSDIFWVVLSNGFSEAVKELLNFKTPIGIAGSLFLIGMGIYFVFFKKLQNRKSIEPTDLAGDVPTKRGGTNYFAILSSGFILNAVNPAVISFWVIISASASIYSLNERIIIFSTCLGMNMLSDFGKVMGAGYIGKKLSDKNIHLINKISGFLYLTFGAIILGRIIFTLIKKH